MFDIGFWELVLISVVGLVVLGPERLPVAIRSVARFIHGAKAMANGVKDELSHELKIQELQENLKKAERMSMENIAPDLKTSVDELKKATQIAEDAVNHPDSQPVRQDAAEAETTEITDNASNKKAE